MNILEAAKVIRVAPPPQFAPLHGIPEMRYLSPAVHWLDRIEGDLLLHEAIKKVFPRLTHIYSPTHYVLEAEYINDGHPVGGVDYDDIMNASRSEKLIVFVLSDGQILFHLSMDADYLWGVDINGGILKETSAGGGNELDIQPDGIKIKQSRDVIPYTGPGTVLRKILIYQERNDPVPPGIYNLHADLDLFPFTTDSVRWIYREKAHFFRKYFPPADFIKDELSHGYTLYWTYWNGAGKNQAIVRIHWPNIRINIINQEDDVIIPLVSFEYAEVEKLIGKGSREQEIISVNERIDFKKGESRWKS